MIIDSSVVKEWIFGNSDKCQKLRKKFEDGDIEIKIPDVVKYDVCKLIVKEELQEEYFLKLVELVIRYLDYFTVNLDCTHLTNAAKLCKNLQIDFSVAACLVLADSLADIYVTADKKLAEKLKKMGYSVLHVNEAV